jgi:hypothetical protein
MHVTTDPVAATALSIYPPQRRSAMFSSRLGSVLARAGVALRASEPPVPLDRIADKLGLPVDGFAAMRSSAPGRWVVGAERAGRLPGCSRLVRNPIDGLRNEGEFLELLAAASTDWRVPVLLDSGVIDGWRVVVTEAIVRQSQRRPSRGGGDDRQRSRERSRRWSSRRTRRPGALEHGVRSETAAGWCSIGSQPRLDHRPMWDLTHYVVQQGVLLGST